MSPTKMEDLGMAVALSHARASPRDRLFIDLYGVRLTVCCSCLGARIHEFTVGPADNDFSTLVRTHRTELASVFMSLETRSAAGPESDH